LYAPDEATAERACRAAFARFAALEDIFSDYRPTSEMMRLCAAPTGQAVLVSPELFFVLERAQRVAEETDGFFDITVGPLVQLWRTARKEKQLPSLTALRAAKARVSWRNIVLDKKQRTVRLLLRGMRLDAGGIAKGYACDEAQKVLRQYGIDRALIEAGGDIVVSDAPPGEAGWKIDVNGETMRVKKCAVSTSGDLYQFVEIGGKRYSHIVSPETGLGLTNRIAVTVIASDGITSDSLSTALRVLHASTPQVLLREYPYVRVFISKNNVLDEKP
jgi:FAD:protein FMN transferase